MLEVIGRNSLEALLNETVPESIRLKKPLDLAEAVGEAQFLRETAAIAAKNKVYKSFIGLGYYGTIVPTVIARNVFENPGWYTAYTPYQAEVAQGRLEALLNFQTVVSDLTGGWKLPTPPSWMKEPPPRKRMSMLHRARDRELLKNNANTFFVSDTCFPQTIEVLETRAKPLGIELEIGTLRDLKFAPRHYGILLQYPDADGNGSDLTSLIAKAHEMKIQLLTVFDENEAGWKVVEDIMKNAKILPSSSRVPKGVADGEYHAGLTYEDAAMRQVAGGAPVGVIYPQDGTSLPPDGNALIKGAKHPKAAKMFLDYVVSKEIMDLLAEKFSLRSARTDVNPPKGFVPLDEIKAVAYDMEWAGKNYQAFIKKWQDIVVRVK